jgi:hypothetical protein
VRARGAILVESAVVAASILTLMLGMIDFGLLGFLQVTVDAGAFLDAHTDAMLWNNGSSPTITAPQYTNSIFNVISTSSIATPVITQPNPVPTVYIDYGYNANTPGTASTNATSRHGGASMMEPYNERVNISQNAFTLFNQTFHAVSSATEPRWYDVGSHWDVNNIAYNTSYSSAPSGFNQNYFTQGENAPLWYTGFNFLQICAQQNVAGWSNNCTNTSYMGLGVAEFLTIYNNSYTTAGVSGSNPGSGVWPSTVGASTGIFYAAACHQRLYADLAKQFAAMVTAAGSTTSGYVARYIENTYNPYANNQTNVSGSSPNANPSDFRELPGVCASSIGATKCTSGAGYSAGQDIRTIYNWDFVSGDAANESYSPYITDVTQPNLGCSP